MATKTPTLDMINRRLGTRYKNINVFIADAELGFNFAGMKQWVLNNDGDHAEVEANPELQNVTMVSPVHDKNARRLLVNSIKGSTSKEARAVFEAREDLVPSWAQDVRAKLAARGLPFSVELLASTQINLSGEPPLFEIGDIPLSLEPLGVLQDGERRCLRHYGAKSLMLEAWEYAHGYSHRPAGAPVPRDVFEVDGEKFSLAAGLTFGQPVNLGNNVYAKSPMMSTATYKAWNAAGQPE